MSWSPDGTFLLFDTGQRTEVAQLARVDLILRTPKFREDQFRDLFNEDQQPRRPGTPTAPTDEVPPKPPAKADEVSPKPATPPVDTRRRRRRTARRSEESKKLEIVFDNIRQRLSLIPTGVDVGEAFISPDGKTAVMIAGAAGQQNLYSWSLDETARERPVARQLTTTAGAKADVSFTPDSKEVFYLDDGRIQAVNVETRATRAVAVTAEMDVDFAKEKTVVFDQAWRLLRDHFFDPTFNGVDWTEARGVVAPFIAGARTPDEMRRIASLMIGELNASHLGINRAAGGRPGRAAASGISGSTSIAREYESSGRLKIAGIVTLGPARAQPRHPARGDYLLAVDGEAVGPRVNLDALLENKVEPPHRAARRPKTARPARGRKTLPSVRSPRRPSAGCATASGWRSGATTWRRPATAASATSTCPTCRPARWRSSTSISTPTTSRATAS